MIRSKIRRCLGGGKTVCRAVMKLIALYTLIPIFAASILTASGKPLDPAIWYYSIPFGILGLSLLFLSSLSQRGKSTP
jgi:hypothetical protein